MVEFYSFLRPAYCWALLFRSVSTVLLVGLLLLPKRLAAQASLTVERISNTLIRINGAGALPATAPGLRPSRWGMQDLLSTPPTALVLANKTFSFGGAMPNSPTFTSASVPAPVVYFIGATNSAAAGSVGGALLLTATGSTWAAVGTTGNVWWGYNNSFRWSVNAGTYTVVPGQAPTAVALSASSVNENGAAGSVVGTFSSTDASTDDSFTYSLVNGPGDTDNASFAIGTGANAGKLLTNAVFDFETKNSYAIRVQTADEAGLAFERTFTINVADVNETPLPVELMAFTATAEGRAARLAWTTASERNSARFEVERSADGQQFATVGKVAAAGSSTAARTYAYSDAAASAGLRYYRLRQVDLDGMFSYSPVRTVALTGAAAGVGLYPNPTHGAATLTGTEPGALVTVLDVLGREVMAATADAAGTAALMLPRGPATGVYVVRVGSKALRLTVE